MPPTPLTQQRWLRIIPAALIMYTISYIDRTNISLALDPKISNMMKDLAMDDGMKGQAAGIFFLGYVLLQMPAGYLASRWSAKKLIAIFLVLWGACAVGCGMAKTFRQFEVMRFFLGAAESGVFPTMIVLLTHWFPRSERARANGYWNLCQPLAVVAMAPITGKLLGLYGWQKMLILEGILPFIWLPIWWTFIYDRPRDAKWISTEEREYLEKTLARESAELEPVQRRTVWEGLLRPELFVMVAIYFLHNLAAYGCMTFLTDGLKERNFSAVQYGVLFAVPYVVTAIFMVVNSWHSDKTRERRGHAAAVYVISGASLIGSVLTREHFWLSYVLMCLAIPGPFAALAPFWAIPAETMPRYVMGTVIGLVNALGNLGGYVGPSYVGWVKNAHGGSTAVPFNVLGAGMLVAAGLCFLLPKARREIVALTGLEAGQ
jgi:sugar phosphate permease